VCTPHEAHRTRLCTTNEGTPLEKRLRNLYALQLIDNNLDEIEDLKGDLPSETREMEAKVGELQERLAVLEREMKAAFATRDNADSEIINLKKKLERYKKQQFEVRNNKEYDALSREMDSATTAITKFEKEMESSEGKATIARTDIDAIKVKIEEAVVLLEEKRLALAEVSKSTEAEELKYGHERKKIVARIDKADLTTYERIRKAKKGKAVVPVKRGACGGCFNRVPPQKLLELRLNDKLYTCEGCGRIVVSDEISEKSSAIA
jgi:predicted  nucleic acid-binding Zn-ribbon protein